jgi:hypothetical protein
MKTEMLKFDEIGIISLREEELTSVVGGGDSVFYTAGFAAGRATVRFLRWLGNLDAECQCYY